MKKYKITPLVWYVKDEKSVKFHIKSDDYFGTTATILSLLKHRLKQNGAENAALLGAFDNLEEDLMFLQKNYRIHPRATVKRKVGNKKKVKGAGARSKTKIQSKKVSTRTKTNGKSKPGRNQRQKSKSKKT
ncbi:MAG: hypothetical protein WC545_01225 [Patescibacteria group bacterium]